MGRSYMLLTTAAVLAMLPSVLTGCRVNEPVTSPTSSRLSPLPDVTVPSAAPTATRLPTTASAPIETTETPTGDEMMITVSEDVYEMGETITFTITNRSDRALYYLYGGCTWPSIRRLVSGDWVAIVVNNTEEFPSPTELVPGEMQVCSWDQRGWQDLDKEGPERFRFYVVLAQVPPGRYRFSLRYYRDRADTLTSENAKITRSRVFSVE